MPEFDIQQAKVFARPVIRSKIYTDPGNREIDISDRIISVGDISQNKTFLGYIDFQAGSNTALYKNTDDFLSFDKLVRLDDERCMVFRYHSGIYTKFIETEDIFPSTVENTDGTLFIAKFRFYALKFILNDFFLGAGSKSTDYAWYAYDVNSFDFQEISVSALDTEIIGGLAVNSDSNFFGKNNGIATWSNNTISNDLMFLQPGRTWGTMTVSYDGGTFTGYPIFLKQGTSTGFSAIPKVDKVYFSPGILFGKKYIGKKIIHQFKFDTMEDNELINIYVGKIETPTESFGVNSEKTIPIESGDIWNLFLENPLGKIDQNGNNRPYISGYKYITPIKVERYRYYNNIRYDIVYKFEIPEEYDWFNVVQVYYLDTNNVAKNVSYSLTTIENGIGYLYFTTERPGQLLVLISNI
ncbi:hypothetical protein HY745_08365, partial [Candidatus Desantisbacteria bacterium]|nr:hypothetical protein [Candidatus Desantisbacteria bacterium]